jgi:hypothetical protein
MCATAGLSATAQATVVTLTAKGQVSNIWATDSSGSVAVPPMAINLGDAFSLSMTFDTSNAAPDPTFEADPSINVYVMPGTATFSMGSYTDNFSVGWTQQTTILLDDVPYGPGLYDNQTFEFIRFGAPQGAIPVDMGDGYLSQGLYFQAYDLSATARDNDLISDLKPLSLFADQRFIMTLVNMDTGLFVEFDATVSKSNLNVPEPASWALMVGGFGLIGGTMRRRATRVRFV